MQKLLIKISNFKCFKEESGFDVIRRVNIIIGRNNSGKSSLLDLIEIVANRNYTFERPTWRGNTLPQVIFQAEIPMEVIEKTFPKNVSEGRIRGAHFIYGIKFRNRTLKWYKEGGSRQNVAHLIECDDHDIVPPLKDSGEYAKRLPNNMPIFIEGKDFKKVGAERNIIPEPDSDGPLNIQPNGSGVTTAIQCFINRSNLPSHLVETEMLKALNEIFAPDAKFTDIVCQRHESGEWEIYLEEEEKGRIPLSESGSGLKTVIIVLTFLILTPHIENKPLNQYVFAFEELENNIHPALLRRLTQYIYKMSLKNDFPVFVTTHSNVLIDQFSRQDDAQILHVTHEKGRSSCRTTKTYIDNNGILDDLDVRASDLLQANGILWVEGPSDRIYLNRWVHLWSKGDLKEGTHYQCIFYGGRLLSHLSATDPDTVKESISILKANRNSIILIDSDKRSRNAPINDTKKRIAAEFQARQAIAWITKGREIENYIPKEAVDACWKINSSIQVEPYASFFGHLDGYKPGEGTKYISQKPLLAERLIEHMTKENLEKILDMDQQMSLICNVIKRWNR